MSKIMMRCYTLSKDDIKYIKKEEYLERELVKTPDLASFWDNARKDLIHNVNVEEFEGVTYRIVKCTKPNEAKYVLFAIGDNKQDVLRKIYLKEEQRTNALWDVSDENKPIKEHIKHIYEDSEVTGKFTENQSKQLLYSLIDLRVKDAYLNNKIDFLGIAQNLDSIKKAFDYTDYISLQEVAKYLQSAAVEIKPSEVKNYIKLCKGKEFSLLGK